MVRLSYSKISDFVSCPRKYWLSYVKCIPLQQNKYLIAGKETHEILYNSTTVDNWKDYILTHPQYKEYKQALDNYITYQEKLVKAGGNPVPEFAEVKFRDEELDFSLVIDRVDVFNGNRLLCDYKTDRLPEEGKHDKQLLLYVYFFNKMNPDKQVTHFAPFYVKARKSANIKPVDPVKMQEAVDWMLEQKKDIESRGVESNKFPTSTGDACVWCTHRTTGMCKQGVDYINKICSSTEITEDVKNGKNIIK